VSTLGVVNTDGTEVADLSERALVIEQEGDAVMVNRQEDKRVPSVRSVVEIALVIAGCVVFGVLYLYSSVQSAHITGQIPKGAATGWRPEILYQDLAAGAVIIFSTTVIGILILKLRRRYGRAEKNGLNWLLAMSQFAIGAVLMGAMVAEFLPIYGPLATIKIACAAVLLLTAIKFIRKYPTMLPSGDLDKVTKALINSEKEREKLADQLKWYRDRKRNPLAS
jgi:hypothetical protein